MLRQTAVIKAVIGLLKSKYNYKIYTDEIVKGFSQPCFFVKLIKRTDTETINTNSNSLSIIITYFASSSTNKEIEYLNMTDDLNLLFDTGFQVGDRYLHVKNVTSERIGEKQDILQITINTDYLDNTNRKDPDEGYDLIGNLVLKENLIIKE